MPSAEYCVYSVHTLCVCVYVCMCVSNPVASRNTDLNMFHCCQKFLWPGKKWDAGEVCHICGRSVSCYWLVVLLWLDLA